MIPSVKEHKRIYICLDFYDKYGPALKKYDRNPVVPVSLNQIIN